MKKQSKAINTASPQRGDGVTTILKLKPPTEEQIQRRANEISQAHGGAPAHELDDWLQAERELKEEMTRAHPVQGPDGRKTRSLGTLGLRVSALGLRCMGMSDFYAPGDEGEAIATIHRAIELGLTLLDTADMYGMGRNEELVGKAIKGRRDQVLIATKFGVVRDSTGKVVGIEGSPAYVRAACEASLKRLGIDTIDLYHQHRVDPRRPIEETVEAMAELVREGKVRFLGLSEAGPDTLRRAHAVHPISALQTEYSLWTRDPEATVLPTVRALGIGFVAYSPLGRGFLTGRIRQPDDLAPNDWRRQTPRFQEGNFQRNLKLVAEIELLAGEKGCTAAQLALAWVLAQGEDIVPIPGTKRRSYLEENMGAIDVSLTQQDLARIVRVLPPGAAAGCRYNEDQMQALNR